MAVEREIKRSPRPEISDKEKPLVELIRASRRLAFLPPRRPERIDFTKIRRDDSVKTNF